MPSPIGRACDDDVGPKIQPCWSTGHNQRLEKANLKYWLVDALPVKGALTLVSQIKRMITHFFLNKLFGNLH